MSKIFISGGMVLLIGFVIMLFVCVDEITKWEEGIEEVKCYDRFNNEIEGLTCYKETTKEDLYFLIGISAFISAIILIFGIIFIKMGVEERG